MSYARHTPFFHKHVELEATFVDRFGFAAAYVFSSTEAEHLATRAGVGVFDVYNQTMIDVQGPDALDLLQWVCVNNLQKMRDGGVLYTSMCNEAGGIIDDLTVFRLAADRYWLSPTPSRVDMVEDWLHAQRAHRVASVVALGYKYAYLSIQGPNARELVSKLTDADLSADALKYFRFTWGRVADVPRAMISRTGYSGELGYELFFPSEYAAHVWDEVFDAGSDLGAQPCGLGALVSLRMEKRYPLYGLDLTKETTPIEAGLRWTVKLSKGDFLGRAALEAQMTSGPRRRLVILAADGLAADVKIGDAVLQEGRDVGRVTSSAKGYSVGATLALAYVNADATGEPVMIGDDKIHARVDEGPLYDPDGRQVRS